MNHDQSRLHYLINRYAANECSREELLELLTIIKNGESDQNLHGALLKIWEDISASDPFPDFDKERILSNIITTEPVFQLKPAREKVHFGWIAYAASVLLVLGIGFGIYHYNQTKTKVNQPLSKAFVISPGTNKAVLILANGSQLVLSNRHHGILATQNHIPVKQLKNGAITYQGVATAVSAPDAYNILKTPRGGQYAITLTDGSKIWLNSESSVKYPVQFNGSERRVELTGEAYFEIAKNKYKPFIVSVNHSEVKVFGTHFNIMGYAEENHTNVTLLEGSVMVTTNKESKMLIPGQQALVRNGITISDADGEQAIAWKNGRFNFGHEHIETIMRKLSRWYDIDVHYSGQITQEAFVGNLPRSGNLADILKTLELTNSVHFKIEGRSVTVMP